MQIRPMLTPSHRESLGLHGYVVISGLLPDHLLRAARNVICSFVNADLDRPETWYAHEPLAWSIVPVHHAQEFWDVRQWPAVHELFASLWGNEKLWVTMNRAVFKVPQSDAHPGDVDESVLHWDLDPRTPISSTYQGMLFLTDAARGEGSFECVPSIFRELDEYLDSHPGHATWRATPPRFRLASASRKPPKRGAQARKTTSAVASKLIPALESLPAAPERRIVPFGNPHRGNLR
jgi:hypothetical protein